MPMAVLYGPESKRQSMLSYEALSLYKKLKNRILLQVHRSKVDLCWSFLTEKDCKIPAERNSAFLLGSMYWLQSDDS